MTTNDAAGNPIDASRAHPARRYNYWLGGKDHFAADRKSGDEIAARWPHIVQAAKANRAFLHRAVAFCARQGIRQFLDIGTGLPTANNTHQVAQQINPTSRIVYADNDPLVLVHARALLTSSPDGATAYLDADLREPEAILKDPALTGTLDLSEPVALLLVAILHFIPDSQHPTAIVDTLKDSLAPNSLLVLSHGSFDHVPQAAVTALTTDDYPGNGDFHPRSHAQVLRFFHGLHLVEPGPDGIPRAAPALDLVNRWGREPGDPPDATPVSIWGGVARKPA